MEHYEIRALIMTLYLQKNNHLVWPTILWHEPTTSLNQTNFKTKIMFCKQQLREFPNWFHLIFYFQIKSGCIIVRKAFTNQWYRRSTSKYTSSRTMRHHQNET